MRKILRRITGTAAIAATSLLASAHVAMAQSLKQKIVDEQKKVGEGAFGTAPSKDLPTLIGAYINASLALMGVIMVGFMIYAGYLWFTAQEDKAQVQKAKDIIKNTVIGAVILFAAYAIANFAITSILTATGQG